MLPVDEFIHMLRNSIMNIFLLLPCDVLYNVKLENV